MQPTFSFNRDGNLQLHRNFHPLAVSVLPVHPVRLDRAAYLRRGIKLPPVLSSSYSLRLRGHQSRMARDQAHASARRSGDLRSFNSNL